ncbi:circumsporozoite precursor [Fusarium agapanthi]|uniref:Circumsporozoite n=1 Tax=Fusarium agapanthi TaxID=1803897 RepID=A0A9P5BE28_9HYPO|nr:circumsporozoite precursor [Fusarium agapanthi]
MAFSKSIILAALLAYAEARFGQEQEPVAAVQALGDAGFGDPGVAATIAGSIPSALLAAASPCDKLTIADQMITELGTDQQVLDAAIGLVAAETNFNPSAVDRPFVCADPSLPATAALRGIVPLVDPAVDGAATENANSATSVTTPFDAAGLSQAEVMIAQGFSTFTAVGANGDQVELDGQDGAAAGGAGQDDGQGDGTGAGADNGADAGADAGAGNGGAANNGTAPADGQQGNNGSDNAQDGNNANNDEDCEEDDNNNNGNNNTNGNNGNNNNGDANNGNGNQNNQGGNNGTNDNAQDGQDDAADDNNAGNAGGNGGNAGALDFGVCQPTMARVGGLNGRPADEFTFIPQDPLIAEGQQEALNPNIITNRICDQLTNVCDASADAVAACEDAQAQIEALGTRDQSTADTWNALLGFDGVDSTQQQV